MPEWLTIDLAQTFVLAAATLLAFLTYRANRRDRWNETIERHLLEVGDRIAAISAAAEELKTGDRSGQQSRFYQAQKRLNVALQFVGPYLEEMPHCEKLLKAGTPTLIRSPTSWPRSR